MSDDATRNTLEAKVDQLITMVKDLIRKHTERHARLERIERVLEQQLDDARPIWEAVPARKPEVGERVGRASSEIAEMRVENTNGFRSVDRKIGVIGKTLVDMTAEIRELQDRVQKIESQPT